MNEKELNLMLSGEAARRQRQTALHMQRLADELDEGYGAWHERYMRLSRVAAMVVLLAVPSVYAMLLPQRDPVAVCCNQRGGDEAVVRCAEILITNKI